MNSNLAVGLRSTAVAIALLAAGAQPSAHAAPPPPPPSLTPPAGNAQFLVIHGQGTQNYICEPSAAGGAPSFVFIGPQSIFSKRVSFSKTLELVQNFQSTVPGKTATPLAGCFPNFAGNEQICPTFQSAIDQSVVWGTKLASLTAGTDPSCPNANSVACLLVQAIAVGPSPSYSGLLSKTSFVQRLDTAGGNPPTTACTPGQLAFVPYSATYHFFSPQGAKASAH